MLSKKSIKSPLCFNGFFQKEDDEIGEGTALLGSAEFQFLPQVRGDAERVRLGFLRHKNHSFSPEIIPQIVRQCKTKRR
nr:MAG TPA: hypothetical protein [Caudoviricetes sp.]DAJ84611.1 MAG TPA: hypothetical protein [Caudoviricetes sp.]